MENSKSFTLLWIGLFAVAMGYLESAVVVYLRTIYYPGGFSFPLKTFSPEIGITELFREAATMVMLLGIGMIAAKKAMVRFALFIYAFAIWDIFYYIFLYVLIGWPSSLMEWDILFLIPVAWIGPVLAPVINSITMILLANSIIYAEYRTGKPNMTAGEWILVLLGSLVTIAAYTIDYIYYLYNGHVISHFTQSLIHYIPQNFKWGLFTAGELLFCASLFSYWRRLLK